MTFPGGKGKSFQKIINLMPPHQIYIEPFLGNGAVVRNKKPASTTIIGDVNKQFIQEFSFPIQNVSKHNSDALNLLKNHELCSDTLVYCDPPYMHETRRNKKIYRYEFSDDQHKNLLRFLNKQSCMVLISGYDNHIYNDVLSNWNKYKFNAQTQAGIREETVWFNYEQPNKLHDNRYIGDNYRERQNIKRRIKRLQNKIDIMCPIERSKFTNWLTNKYPV